jgi:HSP20 family protein
VKPLQESITMNNQVTATPSTPAATAAPSQREEQALLPPVDVIEDATGITLYADMPGVPKDRLALHVDGEQLSLEGEVAITAPQGMEASHAEVQLSRYRRTFTLSRELDPSRINAELQQGVLRVRIPKAEHAQPRKVTVRVG